MHSGREGKKPGQWVQTERAAHEAWGQLIDSSPKAAKLMHLLTARVEDNNAVVVSQKTLTTLMKSSRRTVQRALDVLVADRWIEVRQIGETGTINAYVINDRVAWSGKRDGLRYSLFSATVILSEQEQPDQSELGAQAPLRRLPSLFRDEYQMPSGNGLPPPSEPPFPGMEPDLPALRERERGEEPVAIGSLLGRMAEGRPDDD
jgi:DNA-binding transcriptional MocR family regulator